MVSEKNWIWNFHFLTISVFVPPNLPRTPQRGWFLSLTPYTLRTMKELFSILVFLVTKTSSLPLWPWCLRPLFPTSRNARTWTHIQRFAALLVVRLALGLAPAPVSLALWSSHCEPPAMAPAPNAARAPHRFSSGEQSLTIASKSRPRPTARICLPSLLYIWFAS